MIYLKYSTWNDTTKVFDDSAEASFSEIQFTEVPSAQRSLSATLRGRRVSHLLYSSKIWTLTISCDELADTSKFATLVSLFKAGNGKFSTNSNAGTRWGGSDTTMKTFTVESDKMPIELIEGHKGLPEVTFELFQKGAD